MDKNSIIGWSLIAVLMVFMMNTMQRQKQAQLEEKQKTEQTQERETSNTVNNTNNGTNNTTTVNQNPTVQSQTTVALSDSAILANNNSVYGIFGNYASGNEEDIVVENDVLSITFSNKGGKPKSVILKDYKTHDGLPLEVFSIENGEFNVGFKAVVNGGKVVFASDSLYFDTQKSTDESGNKIISFKLKGNEDQFYEHKYIIPANGYMIDFDIAAQKLQNYVSREGFFEINWAQQFNSLEGNMATEKMYSSLNYADSKLNRKKINASKSASKKTGVSTKWVSFKQKFFSSVLIAKDSEFDSESTVSCKQPDDDDEFVKQVATNLGFPYDNIDYFSFPMQMYFGPNDYKGLKALDLNLQSTVQVGVSVFRWVNLYLIMPTFNFLNKFIGSYGLIILLLTLFIKMIVFPFTYKSHLSMIKMRVLQPELAELKKKFGKDQAKMGPAQMELYRKAGVNPLGGCLPMLFQMPILIAMYRFFPSSLELRQQAFLWAKDLSTFDSIATLPFNIPGYGAHVSLFTILMAITSFFYTRINSQNTPTDPSNPMAAQMKMFQYFMPFMMLFIFNKFSAALSYYYFLFNLISIGQHFFMKKFMIDEAKIHAQIQTNKKKVKTKSKWQTKMEEIMKQQEAQKKNRGKR